MKVTYNSKMKTVIIIILLAVVVLSSVTIILFNTINNNYKEKIFNEYKFDIYESVAISKIEEQINIYIVITIALIIFFAIICFIVSYIIFKKEEENLENITKNIKNIGNRNYEFLIEKVDKGTLGTFQSEIYKTTINLQEYAKQIEEDRKKLSIYLSDISHQLRTPLLSVTVSVDNLLESMTKFPENERKLIFQISTQLDKMKWLVDSLLKMAQFDTKSVILKKENINVKRLIEEVRKNVEILLDLKNQIIDISGEDNITFVGDFKWTVEAITNIVKNAIEHSENGDIIQISYKTNPIYTEIIIEDSGSGISKEDLSHIFDRFYKGENSNKDSFGVGLSLANQIITEQNGEIKIESEINKGTKFIINLER